MTIRFDRFTVKAQEAVQRAQQLAQEHNHQLLEPLHLLAALLTEEQGFVRALLNKVGANVDQLTKAVELELRDVPKVTGGDGQIHISSAMSKVLEAAQESARQMKDEYTSTEHLLLALVQVEGNAKDILKLNAVSESDLLQALKDLRGGQSVTDQKTRRTSIKHSSVTATTWSNLRSRASWIRLLVGIRKFVVSFKSWRDAREQSRSDRRGRRRQNRDR